MKCGRRLNTRHYSMTFEEIAKELGMTYAAVWMTYKRAIRKLRAICL